MYEELIERWARVLCDADHETAIDYGTQDTYPDWDGSNESRRDICREHAAAIFADLEAAGLAIVPEKATEEMHAAMMDAVMDERKTGRQMLNAANAAGRIRREK